VQNHIKPHLKLELKKIENEREKTAIETTPHALQRFRAHTAIYIALYKSLNANSVDERHSIRTSVFFCVPRSPSAERSHQSKANAGSLGHNTRHGKHHRTIILIRSSHEHFQIATSIIRRHNDFIFSFAADCAIHIIETKQRSLGKHNIRDVREFLLDRRLDAAPNRLRSVVLHETVLAIDGQHIHAPAVVGDRRPQYVQVPVHRLQPPKIRSQ
jgi:hypothetical protein